MHCYQCENARQLTDDYPNTDTIYFCEEKKTIVLAGYKCDDFESRVVAPVSIPFRGLVPFPREYLDPEDYAAAKAQLDLMRWIMSDPKEVKK